VDDIDGVKDMASSYTACSEWKKRWKIMNYELKVRRILRNQTQRTPTIPAIHVNYKL